MASGAPPHHHGPTGYGPTTYGDAFADVYDRWYATVTDGPATARFVAARCGAGPVLELGVGTGRLARPLLDVGVELVGLDASAAMLARCAAVVGPLPLIRADMAALPLRTGPGRGFGAVLVAFNTLFNLPTAQAQRGLLAELAPLLAPDGAVIVEALDAAVLAGTAGRSVGPGGGSAREGPQGSPDSVTVAATDVDPAAQTITGVHLELDDGSVRARPWFLRWATVAELDRFALDAGLALVERCADWDGRPRTPGSEVHISVYRPA